MTRRDVWSASDWVRVYIDSYHDRRTAYSFAVNPVGVKLDTYHFNDNNQDDSWDAVWDVQVARDAEGWRAEFRIPLSQLRFSSGGDGRLGFAVARNAGAGERDQHVAAHLARRRRLGVVVRRAGRRARARPAPSGSS